MKRALFALVIAACWLLYPCSSIAQSLQWVHGGGTDESSSYLDNNPEGTYFMCTDQNGNVYAASNVGNNAVIADSFYATGALGLDRNILLTSYSCSGQMRWAKLIASSAGFSYALGLVADSAGHIYLGGVMPNGVLKIGYDTTISGDHNYVLGVAQFDTNGHFNWIRDVGSNTSASYYATTTNYGALAIDGNSNVHLIAYLGYGAILNSTVESDNANYDMEFNAAGGLVSATKVNLDTTLLIIGATIDKSNNHLYAYGWRGVAWDEGAGDSSFHAFIAGFDASDNLLWADTLGDATSGGDQGFFGIAADGQGHLYAEASGLHYLIYRGDTISSPWSSLDWYVSNIYKMNASGAVEWVKQYDGNASDQFLGITLMPNNKIAACGLLGGQLRTDSVIVASSSAGFDPFITIIDTSGNLVLLKNIHGDGYSDYSNAIVADNVGNIYFGGCVADSIPDSDIPAYHSIGGNTDFFVMKYGLPCGCIVAPVAAFTTAGTVNISYTYTGTATGLDSVVWHYGDGTSGAGDIATHSYPVSGTYHVCVYAYTECGVDSSCSDISVVGLGVHDPLAASISVYPNPATEQLTVTGIASRTWYKLLNVTGATVKTGKLEPNENTVSLTGLVAGLYTLELTDDEGAKSNYKVVKE